MTVTPVSFVVGATVARADILRLCARLADLLRARPGDLVVCDVAGVAEPDAVTVEALVRLRLTARRHGRRLVVRGAAPDLLLLVRFFGLADVLPEAGGQPEHGEEPGGVEEVVQRRDPAAG